MMWEAMLPAIGGLFAILVILWLMSLLSKDASIVDRFWGLLFVYLAGAYYLSSEAVHWRSTLIMMLVLIWGVRLSGHIHFRNRGHCEDPRYQKMREKRGSSFWWFSFFSIFLLQGLLAVVISAPLYVVLVGQSSTDVLWSDGLALLLWTVGFAFEAGGDWQLKKFKKDPNNKGQLLTTGFWSLTRHPNYFGDACLWWGFYLFALSVADGWYTIFSPIVMTVLLRFVSGVALLERDLKHSKPGYKQYIEKTPAFFPRLP